jgi:predicted HicB family RNase H-like nuclease
MARELAGDVISHQRFQLPEFASSTKLISAKFFLQFDTDPIPQPGESSSGRFFTRVPKSLYTRLIARTKQEGVSMNALVIAYLAEALGKRETKRKTGRRQ